MGKEELRKCLESVETASGRYNLNDCFTVFVHIERVRFVIDTMIHVWRLEVRHLLDCDCLHYLMIGVILLRLEF